MSLPNIKNKAQVILETVAVFIALTALAIGAIRLFSYLNKDSLTLIDSYRMSRLQATNSFTPVDPLKFLDREQDIQIIGGPGTGGGLSAVFEEDPRILEAEVMIDKADGIINVILPYKTNQASYILNLTSYNYSSHCPGGNCWSPPGYIDIIKSLSNESISQLNLAYSLFEGYRDKLQSVLDEPLVPSGFDPNPEDNPGLYIEDYDPENSEHQGIIDDIREQNENNRDNLSSTLNSFNQVVLPSIRVMLYGGEFQGTTVNGIVDRISYIALHIGEVRCYHPIIGGYRCVPSPRHRKAERILNEELIAGGVGRVNPCVLAPGLAVKITQLYNLLGRGDVSEEDILDADALAAEIAAHPQISGISAPFLKSVTQRLNNYIDYAIRYWNDPDQRVLRDYYIDLSSVESWVLYQVTDVNRMIAVLEAAGAGDGDE